MQYVELSQCLSMSGNTKVAVKFIREYERKLISGKLTFSCVSVCVCMSLSVHTQMLQNFFSDWHFYIPIAQASFKVYRKQQTIEAE